VLWHQLWCREVAGGTQVCHHVLLLILRHCRHSVCVLVASYVGMAPPSPPGHQEFDGQACRAVPLPEVAGHLGC
jgi:hypothetical protein